MGSDIAYPPVEYIVDGKAAGIDPDIAAALGKQLGVKFEFQNGKFAQLIIGLQSKRFNVVMSAMNDTKDRQNGFDSDTGKKVGNGKVGATAAMIFSADDGCDVGCDTGAPVSEDYQPGENDFNGSVKGVEIAIAAATENADHLVSPADAMRMALARQ